MTNLVTIFGASGFLGRHCVRTIARAGWRVRAVTRRPNLANYLLPAGVPGQIQLFKGNVNDEEAVARAIKGADAVINLTGVLVGHGEEQSFDAIHVRAAQRIARLAAATGVKHLVHVSAIGADPLSNSHYAMTKGQGEKRVLAEYPGAVVLRPSLVFGPEDAFFNKFAGLARFTPVLPLIGGGRTKFQPVYVGDVAGAILAALGQTGPKTYELGGPGVYSFKELMQFILRESGRNRLLVPIPFFVATIKGFFLGILPHPLLTMDQVRLLKHDNVVGAGVPGLAELGIQPHAIEAVVPTYLWRYRPKGQFQEVVKVLSE